MATAKSNFLSVKNLKKMGLTALLAGSLLGGVQSAKGAPIDIGFSYGSDNTSLNMINNTGTTINKVRVNLNDFVPAIGDYKIVVGGGFWQEVADGNPNDDSHDFMPNDLLGEPWYNHGNLNLGIAWLDGNDHSLEGGYVLKTVPNGITGFGLSGFPFYHDLALPVPVPEPMSLALVGGGVLGVAGLRRKKRVDKK